MLGHALPGAGWLILKSGDLDSSTALKGSRRFSGGAFLINVSGAFAFGYLSLLFKVDWRDWYGTALNASVLTGVVATAELDIDGAICCASSGEIVDDVSIELILLEVTLGLVAKHRNS